MLMVRAVAPETARCQAFGEVNRLYKGLQAGGRE